MNIKKLVQISIGIGLVVLVIFILRGISKESAGNIQKIDASGVEMTYNLFNKDHQKILELVCQESFNQSSDKMLMKGIRATIYRQESLDRPVTIVAQNGFVEKNFNNFYLENNARVEGENILLTCNSFWLKDRDILTSEESVNYDAVSVKGIAEKGMKAGLKKNILYFYKTNGTFEKDNHTYQFKTNTLKFRDDRKLLELRKENLITDGNSQLSGEHIFIYFTEDLEHLQKVICRGDAHFLLEKKSPSGTVLKREIKSGEIQNLYNVSGQLMNTIIKRNARVVLIDGKDSTTLHSNLIQIHFIPSTGVIQTVNVKRKGRFVVKGKSDFAIEGSRMVLNFDSKGDFEKSKATENAQISMGEYIGISDQADFDFKKDLLILKGKESKILQKKNQFIAKLFHIDTGEELLRAESGIKSLISWDTDNILFSTDPIYIHSEKLFIHKKENRIDYKGNVRLFQNEIVLNAEGLSIVSQDTLTANGNVNIKFKNNEKPLQLTGQTISFNFKDKTVTVEKKGSIEVEKNRLFSEVIVLYFNDKGELDRIFGKDSAKFNKDDLSGSSNQVNWHFLKDLVLFTGNAMITRQDGISTKGDSLQFNLKKNEISILSEEY